MPADPTVRVEYVVRCADQKFSCASEADARKEAKEIDARSHPCGPHRVIKRTITETDVTEDVTDAE